MNGNFFQIACAFILFLATLSACSNEQQIDLKEDSCQGNHQITLSLKAVPETSRGTRAVSVPVDEGNSVGYKVKDFVIFQFDQNGNRLVDPKYYEYNPGESGQTIPIMLPTEDGIEYTIVVLANSHNKLADITFAEATTLDKLMEKYQKLEKLEDSYKYNGTGYDLLMNGYTTIRKNTSSLNVELYRNVAKFTLTITNPATSGVILKSAQVKSVPTKIDYFYHLIEDKKPTALTAPYPAHNKFTTFDYPIDEFEVRPGEGAKVLTYYLPCHLMGTNTNSISEKTKGNYAPDYATFIELYGVSKDGNTFTRYRFYLGDNWTNDYNIKPNYHYQLPIKFSSIGDPQADTRVQHVGGIIEEPDANSYIVNPLPIEEQRMYKIPVAWRINTFWTKEADEGNITISPTSYTIIGENKWAADILCQTSNEKLIQFYDENGLPSDNPIYHGQKPLCFKPIKGAEGNVIIGVYRTDQTNANDYTKREYSWTWHLWITDYNPDECRNQNWEGRFKLPVTGGEVHRFTGDSWDTKYQNQWMMDRFLGAFGNNENKYNEAKGIYYNFGRKDPYINSKLYRPNGGSFTNISYYKDISVVQTTTMDSYVRFPYYITSGYADTKVLYSNDYVFNHWDNPNWNKNKKGKLKKKSFFDPCPPGWRVIENDVWTNLELKNVTTGFIIYCDGIEGSENTDFIPKNAYWNGDFCTIFTSNPSSTENAAITYHSNPSKIFLQSLGRSRRCSIRAIQYDEEADE